MLKTKKTITLTGNSTINDTIVEGYSASINSEDPTDITISSWPVDKTLYKANRVECRKDQAAFEDAAYELQDTMIAEMAKTTE